MVEEGLTCALYYQRLINPRAVGVTGSDVIATIQFKQDVLVVEDIAVMLNYVF